MAPSENFRSTKQQSDEHRAPRTKPRAKHPRATRPKKRPAAGVSLVFVITGIYIIDTTSKKLRSYKYEIPIRRCRSRPIVHIALHINYSCVLRAAFRVRSYVFLFVFVFIAPCSTQARRPFPSSRTIYNYVAVWPAGACIHSESASISICKQPRHTGNRKQENQTSTTECI
jgi:hypothetical protein